MVNVQRNRKVFENSVIFINTSIYSLEYHLHLKIWLDSVGVIFMPYKCRIQDCIQLDSERHQNNQILLSNFEIGWQRVTTNIYEVWTYVNVTPHYHCKQLIVAGVHRYEIDKLSSGMQCFFKWFICRVIWL